MLVNVASTQRLSSLCSTLLVALLLHGCASLSYQEPTSGELARVRFATNTEGVTVLRVYEGAECSGKETEWMRLRVGYLVTGSVKRLGLPLWRFHDNAAKEVYVDSSKPMTAIFWATGQLGSTHYQCGVPFTANFEKDKDYEVYLRWVPNTCRVVISELRTTSTGEPDMDILKIFDNKVYGQNNGCLEQFERFRLD